MGVFTITVAQERPGWRATVRYAEDYTATGATVHAAVTEALAAAGLVCAHHLAAAREACPDV